MPTSPLSAKETLEVPPLDTGYKTSHKSNQLAAVIVAFLIGGLLFGTVAYFFAQHSLAPTVPGPAAVENTPAVEQDMTRPEMGVDIIPEPTVEYETFVNENIKDKTLSSFAGVFSIRYPKGWTVGTSTTESGDPSYPWVADVTYLTKESLKITIIRPGPSGGGGCLYPGDSDEEGPFARYGEYTTLTVDGWTMRRAKLADHSDPQLDIYHFCQFSEESGQYFTPTNFGGISYEVPTGTDVTELDEIVESMKRL